MMLINDGASLSATYNDLLRRRRKYETGAATAKCVHCGRSKADHLNDGRCNVYATSREFLSVDAENRAKIERALVLLEELMGL